MASTEWFEAQYRPWRDSTEIVDLPATIASWGRMSASYLERARVERNIAYGDQPDMRLDVFVPAVTPAPVLILIHGGYWQSLDKDSYAFCVEPLVDAGALVVSLDYSLCPQVTLDEIVEQVRLACAWAYRSIASYGGDPRNIHVTGHSAGGHLSAMMAATDWPAVGSDLPSAMIRSAIPVSGLFDLEPLRHCSVNDAVGMDAAGAMRNSPHFLKPAMPLPISVIVGGNETDEFRRQSYDFVEAWSAPNPETVYLESEGHHHFTVIEAMANSDSVLTRTLLEHLGLKR